MGERWSEFDPVPETGLTGTAKPVASGGSGSVWAWSLACLPFAHLIGVVLAPFAFRLLETFSLIVLLSLAISIALAALDQRLLTGRGFTAPVSPYTAAVPIVYLLLRGHRCTRERFEGYGPAWLYTGNLVVLIALMTILRPWLNAAVYLLDLREYLNG